MENDVNDIVCLNSHNLERISSSELLLLALIWKLSNSENHAEISPKWTDHGRVVAEMGK